MTARAIDAALATVSAKRVMSPLSSIDLLEEERALSSIWMINSSVQRSNRCPSPLKSRGCITRMDDMPDKLRPSIGLTTLQIQQNFIEAFQLMENIYGMLTLY